ncbi:MAG: signal peptidase I [Acutalibacteraceae bacterium]
MKWLECLILQQTGKNHHQTNEWETDKTPQNPKKISRQIWRVIIWIVSFSSMLCCLFCFCKFLFNSKITGHSMQQTIFDGDKVVLNNQDYEPKQGDIVVIAENGTQLDTAIIKRVIAVAGQTIDIDFQTGTVYVDGVALDESEYTENGSTTKDEGMQFPQTVPTICVFVLGIIVF